LVHNKLNELVDCIELLKEPFIIVDIESGKLIHVNIPFTEIYGKDITGNYLKETLGIELSDIIKKLKRKENVKEVVTLTDFSGRVSTPFEIDAKRFNFEGKRYALVHLKDISEITELRRQITFVKRFYTVLDKIMKMPK